ncbi:MAG: hypothetical protein JNM51_09270 [Bacteroidia bacterium]|nr:hypothetical protein [Bacteroidia bacterium]
MKLIKTKKGILASKNYAKIMITNKTNSDYNYQNYKKCLNAIGENGFQRNTYDSNINYKSLLHEHYALLERLKEVHNHSKLENLNKLYNNRNDGNFVKTTPKSQEPRITILW